MSGDRIEWEEGRIELVGTDGSVWTCDEEIIGVILTDEGRVERAWFGDIELEGIVRMRAGDNIVGAIMSGGVTTLASGPRDVDVGMVDYKLSWLEAIRTSGLKRKSGIN